MPAVHVQSQEPLTTSMLASAPPQEEKQMFVEWLFAVIQAPYSCWKNHWHVVES